MFPVQPAWPWGGGGVMKVDFAGPFPCENLTGCAFLWVGQHMQLQHNSISGLSVLPCVQSLGSQLEAELIARVLQPQPNT